MTLADIKKLRLIMSNHCYVDKNGHQYSVTGIHKLNLSGYKPASNRGTRKKIKLVDGMTLREYENEL